eukprot:4551141-Lingulodinium_polyedra.AAC.1
MSTIGRPRGPAELRSRRGQAPRRSFLRARGRFRPTFEEQGGASLARKALGLPPLLTRLRPWTL